MVKIFRIFCGGYIPDYIKLKQRGYSILRLPTPIMSTLNTDQGYGKVKGTVKKNSQNYAWVPICIFKRSNRQLLWEIKTNSDGTYEFKNIAKGLECFIVAFDKDGQYNAVIQDNVVPK